MKKINDFEKKFKDKENILIILDYNGTVASTEPKINSPLSNTTFKRVLENFAKKDYIKIVIITNRQVSEFRKEFGLNAKEISIIGFSDGKFKDEKDVSFDKKENIIGTILAENSDFEPIYIGDDKSLIDITKKSNGNAIGILPLCSKGEKLVDFSISQNRFEEALITTNNLYL